MVAGNKIVYYAKKIWKKLYYGIPNYMNYMVSLFMIRKNKKRIKEKISRNDPLNVVFIVQYIPAWNKLEIVYNKMQKDDRYNPIIVCVPLEIQNNVMKCKQGKNDSYEYFERKGYNAINALIADDKWFDLKSIEPDYVFHTRPYNQFMPKCYTSKVIGKYALLCNILYGASLTENGQKVTLNKDYFNDVYCYFAFDNSEKRFYEKRFSLGCIFKIQKCYPYGATALEQVLSEKKEYKNDLFSKTVLWTPRWSTDPLIGGSNFFNYVQALLEFARQNKNVLFIIRPHPLMFENFIKTGEMTGDEVKDFKEYCKRETNIQLDEAKEYISTFWKSDILITDVSGIIPEYFMTKKPIIYCYSQIQAKWSEYASEIINASYPVYNKKELFSYIEDLLSDRDVKAKKRQECMNALFTDVNNNSNEIIESLIKL